MTLDFGQDWEINDSVYFFVNEGIEEYRNKYDYLKRIDKISQWRLSPSSIFSDMMVKRKVSFLYTTKLLVLIHIVY